MSYWKSIAIVLTTAVCATAFAADAGAQSRGRSSGGRGPTVGRAAPRSGGPRAQAPRSQGPRTQAPRGDGRRYDSRGVSPRVNGRGPLRSYSYPHSYYGYRPGFSLGLYYGSGYPVRLLRLPYGYPCLRWRSYGGRLRRGTTRRIRLRRLRLRLCRSRRATQEQAYGGIRIQGAPRDAQVYVDGYYAGIVDDYDGTFQRLDLEPGSHEIEIRTAGRPLTYDVNVTPGQTLTIHANVR